MHKKYNNVRAIKTKNPLPYILCNDALNGEKERENLNNKLIKIMLDKTFFFYYQ